MADVTKITLPNGTTKDIKDATARTQANWNTNNGVKNFVKTNTITFERSTIIDVEPISGVIAYSIDNIVSSDTTYTTSAILLEYTNGQQSKLIQLARGQKVSGTVNTENLIVAKIYLYASTGYTASGGKTATFTNIMLTTKSLYDADSTYQPYALPNTKITPELIELVDSGAKNTLNTQGATISSASGVTITRNSDGTFNISRSTSGSVSNNYVLVYINAGSYMLSGVPAGGSSEQWIMDIRTNESQAIVVGEQDTGNGAKVTIPTSDYYRLTFRLGSSYSGTQLFKPMLCSKAAWDVSQKFVPYRPTYEETVEQVAENENNISWIANYGGYKNIIKVTKDSIKAANPNLNWQGYTAVNHGGLTFAINDDLSITINGTTTAGGIEFLLKSRADGLPLFPVVGEYRIDGKIISGKGSLVVNRTIDGSGVRYGADTGDTDTFTVNQADLSRPVGVWFGINVVGVSFDDVTICPMICLASMDRTYQPYCPSNYDLYKMILAL